MQKLLATLLTAAALAGFGAPALAQSRIKDIAAVEGVRSNQLVGYGLVVGLNGTGDSLRNCPFTRQSLEGMTDGWASTFAGPTPTPRTWPPSW